jgi:hypothetical protein
MIKEEIMSEDEFAFVYKGLECTIVERPDRLYCRQVHGFRESDSTHWLPGILFDTGLSFGRVRDLAISMIDGNFIGKGKVRYGIYMEQEE